MKRYFVTIVAAVIMLSGITVFSQESKFKSGAALRLRYEYWGDLMDFDRNVGKNESFLRIKPTAWASYACNSNFLLYGRLANEMKFYFSTAKFPSDNYFYEDEILVDNAYFDWKNIGNLPITARIGRQDFLGAYGEGFLIMDGTPGDGSRTFYFNAARVTWKINDKSTVDFDYINDFMTDPWPVIKNKGQLLNATTEQAVVVYGNTKVNDEISVEPYFINKIESSPDTLNLNTLGARVVYKQNLQKIRGELAYQTGKYDSGTSRTGLGMYAFYTYSFKDAKFTPDFEAGYVYLSGNDPNTTDNESFDPLFSRWPWLSELFLLTLAKETGIAGYWTNLQIFRVGATLMPIDDDKTVSANVTFSNLRANQETKKNNSIFSNNGSLDRGNLVTVNLKKKINDRLSAYVLGEILLPGDFYTSSDYASFFRTNIDIKF